MFIYTTEKGPNWSITHISVGYFLPQSILPLMKLQKGNDKKDFYEYQRRGKKKEEKLAHDSVCGQCSGQHWLLSFAYIVHLWVLAYALDAEGVRRHVKRRQKSKRNIKQPVLPALLCRVVWNTMTNGHKISTPHQHHPVSPSIVQPTLHTNRRWRRKIACRGITVPYLVEIANNFVE